MCGTNSVVLKGFEDFLCQFFLWHFEESTEQMLRWENPVEITDNNLLKFCWMEKTENFVRDKKIKFHLLIKVSWNVNSYMCQWWGEKIWTRIRTNLSLNRLYKIFNQELFLNLKKIRIFWKNWVHWHWMRNKKNSA